MKKTIAIIAMLTLVFAMVLTGSVNAAADVTVTAPTEAVAVEDTVVVTITPSEVLKGLNFRVNYDETVLEFVGYEGPSVTVADAAASTAGEVAGMFATTGDAVDMTVKLTFKALAESTGTEVAVTDLTLSNADGESSNPAVAANTVVVGEAAPVEPEDPTDPVDPEDPTDPVDPANPGETGLDDEKPGIPQTGANIFAYVVSGIALVAVLALVVKAKKD